MPAQNISRRSLLQSIPGLAAVGAVGARTSFAQEYRISGADIRLGVASYSFRKFSRAQAIEMTAKLGTPYINVKDFHLPLDSTPAQIDAAKKEFADAGLILVGCGNISFTIGDEKDIRHKFDYARRAGFPLIVCAPTHTTLPKLEPFVREYDIKIAIHNHGPEDKNFPTPQSVLDAVKNMDPRCGLCMDVGHTSRTGVDIVAAIAQAGPRLLDMHIKDLADPMGKSSQVPVGQGKLPIAGILQQLVKINYRGSVNLEYEIQEDHPFPGMQESFTFLRKLLTEMQRA